MTHTVIEKMARAMSDRAGFTEYGPVIPPSLLEPIARAALLALRDSVDHSTPVTAQIVRAYVDGVLGENNG